MEKIAVFTTTEDGACRMEHSIPVEKKTCDKLALFIEKEQNRIKGALIKGALKDFHIDHRLNVSDYLNEGISFAGRLIKNGADPVEEAEKLANDHKEFLNWLIKASEEMEEPNEETPVEEAADDVKKFSDFVKENSDNEEEEFLLYAGMCALEHMAHHFGGRIIILC